MVSDNCPVGEKCTQGLNNFPCICKCEDTNCSWKLLNPVEKMTSTITKRNTAIYHTNFPVSADAISSFRNPLSTVSFYIKRDSVPMSKIMAETASTNFQMKEEPRMSSWQQPIIQRSHVPDKDELLPTDQMTDVLTNTPRYTFRVFKTPNFAKNGNEYKLKDKFVTRE